MKPLRFADRRAIAQAIRLQRHTIQKMEQALDRKYEELRKLESLLPQEQEEQDAYNQPTHQETAQEPEAEEQDACPSGLSAEERDGHLDPSCPSQEA